MKADRPVANDAPMGSTSPAAPSRGYRVAVVSREIVLWIGSVVGVCCLVVAAAALLFGVTPLVFRSGSMSPQIPTGSVALARETPASDLHAGDVVSVIRADGERVTHRLVSARAAGDGRYSLVVKGDANAEADPEPVVTRSVDRVFWSAPRLGYVLQAASRPQVLLPLGALFGVLAVIGFRPPLDKRLLRDPSELTGGESVEPSQDHVDPPPPGNPPAGDDSASAPRHRLAEAQPWTTEALTSAYDARRLSSSTPSSVTRPIHRSAVLSLPHLRQPSARARGGALGLVALLIAAASATGLHTTATLAAFTDAGGTTGTFTSGKVAAPDTFTCTIVSGKVRFAWTVPASTSWAPTSFVITNTGNGTTTVVSSGATRSIDVSAPVVSLGGLTNFVYTIQSRLDQASSTSTQTRTVVALLGLAPTCS